jgi:hypothetical protein
MSNQPNPNVFFRGEDMGIGNFPIKGGTINDGGPAFPTPAGIQHNDGLSLRDYFAAAAMQGILADGGGASWDDDAKNAFKAADSMLKAREAK